MVTCPHCQTENQTWARFCAGCGQPLPQVKRPAPLDLEDDGPVASTQPLGRPTPPPGSVTVLAGTGTRPLNTKVVFGPRPDGAIFGDRFLLARLDTTNSHQQRYLVNEITAGEPPRLRQCGQCGAVHGRPHRYCTACGAELSTQAPALWLTEASTRAFFGPTFELAAHALAHPALRVPLASFEERLGASLRYCVISPAVQPLPAHLERPVLFESAAGLIDGLHFLHGVGLSFGGKLTAAAFALAGSHVVWADLAASPIHTDPSDKARAADTRALAQQLYTWLTGRPKFAADVPLAAPLKALFAQALNGRGFPSAQAFGVAWAEAYQPEQPRPQVDMLSVRRTDVGRVRNLNEDSVLALELVRVIQSQPEPLGLYAVADGMGGHSAGEIASSTIVQALMRRAVSDLDRTVLPAVDPVDYLAWVRALVEDANRALFDLRKQAGTDMGSTLVAVVVDGAQAYVAHVGDSRAYLIDGRGIHRLTEDHSLVERLVATGQITADQARTHEQRNVIYRTMGDKAQVEVQASAHPVAPGDRLLLCSDGLNSMVEDASLLTIIQRASSLQAACDQLIAAANAAGGTDNISAILVEVAATQRRADATLS